MEDTVHSELLERFSYLSARESLDWPAVNCPPENLVDFLQALRDDYGFTFLTDVTAVDWEDQEPRFTGVYHLYHLENHYYLRVASDCRSGTKPSLPSVTHLFPSANWHERETYDMFGITYEGHPDLRRILMWDGYPYYPLRKEFPLAGLETELPPEDPEEQDAAPVLPAPMMGGPFTAKPGQPMSRQEPRAKDQSWTERDEPRFRKEEE